MHITLFVEMAFLPPNTTSIVQPCDQGIIRSFKSSYRQEISKTILSQLDDGDSKSNQLAKKVSLLQSEIVLKSFVSSELEVEDTENLYLPPTLLKQQFEDWNCVDQNVETAGELCDEDILSNYNGENHDDEHDSETEDDEESNYSASLKIPTNKEMLHALAILKSGIMNLSTEFQIHCDYENFILNLVTKNKKQAKIDDFLKKM